MCAGKAMCSSRRRSYGARASSWTDRTCRGVEGLYLQFIRDSASRLRRSVLSRRFSRSAAEKQGGGRADRTAASRTSTGEELEALASAAYEMRQSSAMAATTTSGTELALPPSPCEFSAASCAGHLVVGSLDLANHAGWAAHRGYT